MEFSDFYDSDASIKINDVLIECSSKKVRLSVETLMEGIKAVVSEKLQFENRDKSKLKDFFLEILDDQKLDKWMKTNGLLIKSFSTCVKFLIQDLMEEIKPLNPGKSV